LLTRQHLSTIETITEWRESFFSLVWYLTGTNCHSPQFCVLCWSIQGCFCLHEILIYNATSIIICKCFNLVKPWG
jgi:hypothetical protein